MKTLRIVGYLPEPFHGRVKTLRIVGYLPESFHGRVKTLRVVGYLPESFHGRVKTLRIVGYLPESFHGRVKTLRIVGYLSESFHVFRYLPDFCGIAYIMCTHSVYVAHICVLLRILFVCSIVFAPPLGQHIFMLRHLSCSCSVHRYAPLALPSFLHFSLFVPFSLFVNLSLFVLLYFYETILSSSPDPIHFVLLYILRYYCCTHVFILFTRVCIPVLLVMSSIVYNLHHIMSSTLSFYFLRSSYRPAQSRNMGVCVIFVILIMSFNVFVLAISTIHHG